MVTLRDRIEQCLRSADPDTWLTQREIAERLNAKPDSVRNVMHGMLFRERIVERRQADGHNHNPQTGDRTVFVYRWTAGH